MIKDFQFFLRSVRELGLPYLEFKGLFTLSFKVGSKKYLIRGGDTPFNNGAGISLTSNTYCVNQMLGRAKFPVPRATAITTTQYHKGNLSLKGIQFPVVIKPTAWSEEASGVICNLPDEQALEVQLKKGFKVFPCLSIEEFHAGLRSYRVLLYQGNVLSVVERTPAIVTGDGSQTLAELIEAAKKEREKQQDKYFFDMLSVDDEELQVKLQQDGRKLEDIPRRNEQVVLSYTCNLERGGSTTSLGVDIDMETADMLARAAERLGLSLAGFDVLCEDITKPFKKGRDVIVDVSASPDIALHEMPMYGEPRQVSKMMLKQFIERHRFEKIRSLFFESRVFKSFYFRAAVVVGILLAAFQFLK